MIRRIMPRPSHRSFAWPSQNILSRLLVIDLQAGKFRTIPAMKYRPAVLYPRALFSMNPLRVVTSCPLEDPWLRLTVCLYILPLFGAQLLPSASAHIARISCHHLSSVVVYFSKPNVEKWREVIQDKNILRKMACKRTVADQKYEISIITLVAFLAKLPVGIHLFSQCCSFSDVAWNVWP